MTRWIFLLLCFCLGGASVHASAAGRLDISTLNAAELNTYGMCRREFFTGATCKALLSKVCAAERNYDEWDCIEQKFEACSAIDYAGTACEALLQKVCDRTSDQYGSACDRYRYESCLRKDFAPDGCKEIRVAYTLPKVSDVIDAEAVLTMRETPELKAAIANFACTAAEHDTTNPLFQYCLSEPLQALELGAFEDLYQKSLEDNLLTPAVKHNLLTRLLESPRSPNQFDRADALRIWLREDDETAGAEDSPSHAVRALAMRVLAELGDDGVITTFELVVASQDEVPAVRAAALQGLGSRSYGSGLAIIALVRGLNASTAGERAAAYKGLANRWQQDLQSTRIGMLDEKQLLGLFDCRQVAMDVSVYDRVLTMADANRLDLLNPAVLCSIGRGARLFRLKNEMWANYVTMARSPSASLPEREAAIQGLAVIAVTDLATKAKANIVAKSILQTENSVAIRVEALRLLRATTLSSDAAAMHQVFAAMDRELVKLLRSSAPQISVLQNLLDEMRSNGFFDGTNASGETLPYSALPHVREECLAQEGLSQIIRANCYAAISDALDPASERIFWPVLMDMLKSPIYATRVGAFDILDRGVIKFIADGATSPNCERRGEMARALSGELSATLTNRLTRHLGLLDPTWKAFKAATIRSPAWSRCSDLPEEWAGITSSVTTPATMSWLRALIASMMPRLPMKSWYDGFRPPASRADIVERVDLEQGPQIAPYHQYRVREEFRIQIHATMRSRSVEQMFLRSFVGDTLKDLYTVATAPSPDTLPDLKIEFWGVTNGSHP